MAGRDWKRGFFTIWAGQQLSLFGSAVAQFGLIWWLTNTTGSATVLATASLAALLPSVLLGPMAGTVVDRTRRKLVMIGADSIIAGVSLLLALLFWTGRAEVWHIFLVAVVRGIGGAFHGLAWTSSVSLMVPKEHLSRIAGLNQTMQGARSIAIPPLAALLLSVLPIPWILTIDVVTAALAVLILLFVPVPQPREAAGARPSYLRELREGFAYVWRWKGLMILLVAAALLSGLLSPAFSLLPLFVSKHLGKGAVELGLMKSAFGVGMILGGVFLGGWGGFKRKIHTALSGFIGMGLGVTALGFIPPSGLFVAVGAMFAIGLMNPMANGPIIAILQSAVAPEIQGRVFSLVDSLASGMSPLGLAVAGPVADLLGVQAWFLAGGVALLLMGLFGFFIPALVNIEESPGTSRG
ncbi:MAG: MFS transporter [Candidatus Bipolaricaulaceae bacterium]